MTETHYQTDQEYFWSGKFGDDYISRNNSRELLASNLYFFSQILKSMGQINSCIEYGANIGMNLQALKLLCPTMAQYGIEINSAAAKELEKFLGDENVFTGSMYDYVPHQLFDLVLVKGVLIHINPNRLEEAYYKLYHSTQRYILLCEYYNPQPVMIPYRGHMDRLFKRDFCGEMLKLFLDLRLIDYGFVYRHDANFPQDDITWFLLEKGGN